MGITELGIRVVGDVNVDGDARVAANSVSFVIPALTWPQFELEPARPIATFLLSQTEKDSVVTSEAGSDTVSPVGGSGPRYGLFSGGPPPF